MFDKFYNQAIRKLTVAFGTLFNNVYVIRLDQNGGVDKEIRVPLAYGPKEKWIRKLDEQQFDFEMELPRMSFNISSISYDPARKKNTLQKRTVVGPDNSTTYSNFVEVPYDVEFELSAMVKFVEDGLSITEQILPFFTPEFTVSINFNEVNQNVDVPIVLNSVLMNEEYEGAVEGFRLITIDFSFTAKTSVFGPVKTSKPIQKVLATIYESEAFYLDGFSSGISGNTVPLSKVDVGVTGPSGASSGIDNFTDYTTEIRVLGHSGGFDSEGNDL